MADQPKKTSSASGSAKVAVKKVRAYPIAGMVEYKGVKKPIQIAKLAGLGAWATLGKTVVQVGVTYKLEFELPVLRENIAAPAKVLRTMDRVQDVEGAPVIERLAEFQFINPPEDVSEKIKKFLSAINQAG